MHINAVCDVTLHPSEAGSPVVSLLPGKPFGCQCYSDATSATDGWSAFLDLDGMPFGSGETRRLDVTFLAGDRARLALAANEAFYIRDGRVIGTGRFVTPSPA